MTRRLVRMTIASVLFCGMFSTGFAAGGGDVITSDTSKHFDEKGKLPSEFTIELQAGLRKTLPF